MARTSLIDLSAGDYRLVLQPAIGGSIARFDWQDEPLMRPATGATALDAASFPLVPFSNRIAHGRFDWGGRAITIAPNFPGGDHPHPLHGFGWLCAWDVIEHSATRAVLRHRHEAGAWPWAYVCEQIFSLSAQGLRHALSLRNLDATPMPAGLGFHPYFPRDAQTIYYGLHGGEWQTSDDGLPIALHAADRPVDWWSGQPVGQRAVDTVYTGRDGPLTITWPGRNLELAIAPCADLPFTVVYSPPDADVFCVEPVSHATDAINRRGFRQLDSGATFAVHVDFAARRPQVIPKMRPSA